MKRYGIKDIIMVDNLNLVLNHNNESV